MNNINTLKYLLELHGTSENEKHISRAVLGYLKNIKNPHHKEKIIINQDENYNIWGEVKYGDSDIVIGLNAHLDTVRETQENRTIEFHEQSQTFRAFVDDSPAILGADDRAGVFAILQILESKIKGFDGTIKFFFTVQEETGCFGAMLLDTSTYEDVDLMIVLDRRGSTDVVVSTSVEKFCGDFLISRINGFEGFRAVEGGVSDAYVFSRGGIQSLNFSVGYYNEHTVNEYLKYDELLNTIEVVKEFISLMPSFVDKARRDTIEEALEGEYPFEYNLIDGDDDCYCIEMDIHEGKILLIQDGYELRLTPRMARELRQELEKYDG